MENYRTPSKESQEFILANVTYEAVIDGLNGYFASEPRNDYITVKMESDKQNFALYEAEAWADILISWLRTKHGIFYYPGMEAKHAKIERIPPFTERMIDKYIIKSIMCDIRQEASRNGFNLPEEIDGEPLTIERTFHDLLELLMKRTKEIREVNDKRWKDLRDINKALGYDGMDGHVDDFATAVKARAEYVESLSRNAERKTRKAVNEQLKKDTDYVADTLCDILEALGISKSNTAHLSIPELKDKAILRASVVKSEHGKYLEQLTEENEKLKETIEQNPSDVNKLIRDCCAKHSIIAPSRYFSDEACIEYLFSLIEQKDRSRAEIENYKLKLKDYILKDIKEHGYRYDGLQTKSIEEIVDWIITMATLDRSSIALRDIYTTVASPVERRRYNIDDCDGTTASHMKDYILRRFEGLRINIEYCLKKMSELDGCQKDLKILEEQQEFLVKQNMELSCKICAKDGEISRLKDLINAMNEEAKDM